MKKLFIVLAVATLGFAACNSEGENTTTPDTAKVETPVVTPAPDSPAAPIDSPAVKLDSPAVK